VRWLNERAEHYALTHPAAPERGPRPVLITV
jgi:hypothetical protein